jgi:ribosomal protein L11 methylase PrmA
VTANLTAGLLSQLASSWSERAGAPATLIASGFLEEESAAIEESFARAGLETDTTMVSGGWAALLARARARE